jgi:hypothetical protein
MKVLRVFQASVFVVCSLAVVPQNTFAQASKIVTIQVSAADVAASSSGSASHSLAIPGADRRALWAADNPSSGAGTLSIPSLDPGGFYPGDVSNPQNSTIVTAAQHHPLYVNCLTLDCWGTPGPAGFLNDLDNSTFLHLVDQYVGSTANGRYTLGNQAVVITGNTSRSPSASLFMSDLLAIVHAGAAVFGTGYGHIYHIFVKQGVDVCKSDSNCYSPDYLPAFKFCAFHMSTTFSDIGHVVFSVEPFQNVPQCSIPQPSPNGSLIDSTASVLAHEVFELITDPDLNAWANRVSSDLSGAEIADICQNLTGQYAVTSINGKNYEVQAMYSNALHGCSFNGPSPAQ